jgi:hypothetical protein
MDIDGLVLESKYPEYQFLIKGPLEQVWRDGFPVQENQIIALQFDRYLCEVDLMAQNQEWGEAQKQAVAGAIKRQLDDPQARDMWVHVTPKPPKPWPTYDDTLESQVVSIAQATGTVSEALVYEQRGREGGPREKVVAKLQELHDSILKAGGATLDPNAETEEIFAA